MQQNSGSVRSNVKQADLLHVAKIFLLLLENILKNFICVVLTGYFVSGM